MFPTPRNHATAGKTFNLASKVRRDLPVAFFHAFICAAREVWIVTNLDTSSSSVVSWSALRKTPDL
jgi:hypothetical protein